MTHEREPITTELGRTFARLAIDEVTWLECADPQHACRVARSEQRLPIELVGPCFSARIWEALRADQRESAPACAHRMHSITPTCSRRNEHNTTKE